MALFSQTPNESLEALKKGNQRYLDGKHTSMAEGQAPFATVIACSDSRVAPELIFNQNTGDLFVVRLAGNVVGDLAIASIEFAAGTLGTPLIVVMGHQNCGAVQATIDNYDKAVPGSMGELIAEIRPAVKEADFNLNRAIQDNVRNTAQKILRSSPTIRQLVKEGKVEIVLAEFHLESGEVEWLNDASL